MEHYPFITLQDETEITYSDVKKKEDGSEYISLYFETPTEEGFSSMTVEYPEALPKNVKGYSKEEVIKYMRHFEKVGALAFEFAKEDEMESGKATHEWNEVFEKYFEEIVREILACSDAKYITEIYVENTDNVARGILGDLVFFMVETEPGFVNHDLYDTLNNLEERPYPFEPCISVEPDMVERGHGLVLWRRP